MKNNGEIFIGALEGGKIYVFNILHALFDDLNPEVTFVMNPASMSHATITSICHLSISTRSNDALVLVQGELLHAFVMPSVYSGQIHVNSFVLTESGQAVAVSQCSGNEQQGIVNVQILEPPPDDTTRDARLLFVS